MKLQDVLLALIIALFWGFNYVAVKSSVTAFGAMTTMSIRYAIVVLLLLPFLLKIKRVQYLPLLKVSLTMGFLYFAFFFWAIHYVAASLAALILQLQVPFSLIFSFLLLKEPPSPLAMIGTVIAFLGVFYAVGHIPWHGSEFLAVALLVIGAALWAYGSTSVRKMRLSLDPLTLNAGIAVIALPGFIIASLVLEPSALQHVGHVGLKPWLFILYMVLVSTLFCYSNWFRLLQTYNITLIMPFVLLVPIFALLCDHVFLSEPLTHRLVIGGVITVFGVGLVVLPKSLQYLLRKSREAAK